MVITGNTKSQKLILQYKSLCFTDSKHKTPLQNAEEFFFWWRYNLRPFTDTNSVICKMIVGERIATTSLRTGLAMTEGFGSRCGYRTFVSFRGRLRPWESVFQHLQRRKI